MDLTEDKREEITMTGNKKTSDNKTGTDSTETEKSEKTISKKRSEPQPDKPNPKYMKITLPASKSDEKRFSIMSRSHEDDSIPRKKKKKYQKLQSLQIK